MIPDVPNTVRMVNGVWAEAHSLPTRKERWRGYGIAVIAYALIPVVSVFILFQRRDK